MKKNIITIALSLLVVFIFAPLAQGANTSDEMVSEILGSEPAPGATAEGDRIIKETVAGTVAGVKELLEKKTPAKAKSFKKAGKKGVVKSKADVKTAKAVNSTKNSTDATNATANRTIKYGEIGLLLLLIIIGIVGIYFSFRTGKKVETVGEKIEDVPLNTAKLTVKEVLIPFTVNGKDGMYKAPIVANGAIQVLHLKENGTLAYFFKERDARNSLSKTIEEFLAGTVSGEQREVIESAKSNGRLEI